MYTAQELACGAVERRYWNNDTLRLSLWREHGVYHVRLGDLPHSVIAAWNTYNSLTEARAFFRQVVEAQETETA